MADSKRPDNLKVLEDTIERILKDKTDEKSTYIIDKKFRFANQYVMLTYKTHMVKEDLRAYFKDKFNVKEIEIAHETGKSEETPYPHTHVVINFGRRFQSTNVRIFDINDIHPHMQPFRRHEWGIKTNYLAKEDPENVHLKKNNVGTLASKIWKCETVQEALMTAQTASDVNGIVAMYNNKPVEKLEDKLELRDWQKDIWEKLQKKPNDREVIWIRDVIGGAGKSRFTRWMLANEYAIVFKQFGGTRDSASIVADAVARGWDQKIIICDLSRDFEDRQIYAALESLKDGMVTTTKYVGKTIAFKCPHVVVFANFWPDVIRMSLDRWSLYDVFKEGKNGAYNIKQAPVEDILKLQHGNGKKE